MNTNTIKAAALAVVAAALAVVAVVIDKPRDCPRSKGRLLLFGDSYALGLFPLIKARAVACGSYLEGQAVSGDHVEGLLQSIPAFALAPGETVLISMGGNDYGRHDPANVEAKIAEVIALIKDAGAVPVWISPPTTPFEDEIGVRDMWLTQLGASPAFDSRQLELPRVPGDPLGHPTPAGYADWAAAVWRWLSQMR